MTNLLGLHNGLAPLEYKWYILGIKMERLSFSSNRKKRIRVIEMTMPSWLTRSQQDSA